MRSEGQNKASFKDVNLGGAKVTGQIDMRGASIHRELYADSLQVGGRLLMRSEMPSEGQNKASFKDVKLGGAKVTGQIDMRGASIDGTLDADSLQAGGDLFMRSEGQIKASFKHVNLRGAKVTGQIVMIGASIDDKLYADSLQVGGDLSMNDAHTDKVQMVFAHVGSNLDLSRATFADLDLSGASVTGDLRLARPYASRPWIRLRPWTRKNGESGALILYNAHIGNLVDAKDAWPKRGQLYLDGFSFTNLGGFGGNTGQEMRGRGMDWWDKNWAQRDEYSPGPYAQLAAALTNSGDRQAANEIRYLGREAERENEWKEHEWGAWLFRSALCYVAGYGIGLYSFRVVWWVLGLSLIFAALLWWLSQAAREKPKGRVWCFGASLSRLLPGIELNKEFADFFNDPDRVRLKFWPSMLFSALGVLGWLLAAVLIVAVSGLTQSS